MSMRSERERIQGVQLVLSEESRLDSSVTKVSLTSPSHSIRERQGIRVRSKGDSLRGYSKRRLHSFVDGAGIGLRVRGSAPIHS